MLKIDTFVGPPESIICISQTHIQFNSSFKKSQEEIMLKKYYFIYYNYLFIYAFSYIVFFNIF